MLSLPVLLCFVGALASGIYPLLGLDRRLSNPQLGWVLSLAPFSAFIWLFVRLADLLAQTGAGVQIQRMDWLPSLGISASLYLDGLSGLFALLVTGIGALVVVYAAYYFKKDEKVWRFYIYIFLFMGAMLGLVLAGDLITLFIFWEGTSVVSFLLVAYKYKDDAARRGAFKALLITGGGGIALLAGFLFLRAVTGSTDLASILTQGDTLRQSPLYPLVLGLIVFGAFTKSAQAPAHIWLPSAMSAPTPASAYLHSATMVKAGIYLLARLNPALGQTDLWFWILSGFGLLTMLTGAYLGFKQHDLKALLAYSTISQLGAMVMLIGQDTEIAFKALVIAVLAHALYKSALFLVAGIVDHQAGTRDLRQLGGLRRWMPATFSIGALAALSMAGLPPLFGFLAKETLLATVTHPSVPMIIDWILTAGVVIAGALLLAQAGLFVFETFLGEPKSDLRPKEAAWAMWLMPAVPAGLSFLVSALPEPALLANLLASAAASAFGNEVKVSLALWTGLSVPLLLSMVAVSLGSGLLIYRRRLRAWLLRQPEWISSDALLSAFLAVIDRAAYLVTRTQNGRLRNYLAVMLAALGGMLIAMARLPFEQPAFELPALSMRGEMAVLRLFTLSLAVAAAAAAIFLQRDFFAVLALGASGLSVAVLMILEPAPDVALVQIVVDLLLVVILVLALTRMPREQRTRAGEFTFRQGRIGLARDALIAVGAGVVGMLITLYALASRPRLSVVTPYYEVNAKPLTGAQDVVGAIVADFRGYDTLVEITVFAMAGIGAYMLLRYASRKAGDQDEYSLTSTAKPLQTRGIGGQQPSPILRVVANIALPISMVIAATHILYGHAQPGDGFTAGVIISLGVGFWYIIFGYEETKRRLHWSRPALIVGAGLLLAILNGLAPLLLGGQFFAPLDYGAWIGLAGGSLKLTTSLVFEVAIGLSVVGGVFAFLDALGHPKDDEEGSSQSVLDRK